MNRVIIACLAVLGIAGPALSAPIVELTITERGEVNRVKEPVLIGVPLPEAMALTDTSLFSLRDPAGNVIPCEFRIAAQWLRNRSAIRWLHLDFQTDLNANQSKTVWLHSETSPVSVSSNLSAQDQGAVIQVNTGVIRFNVKKANFNLLDEVWVDESGSQNYDDAHKIVATHAGGGLVHKLGSVEYFSGNDAASTVSVERQGPMAVVLKATGQLKNSGGTGSYHFITRIYAYNNSKIVKIDNTIEYRNNVTNSFLGLHNLKAEIPLNLGAAKTALVGKPGGQDQSVLGAGEESYCFVRRQGVGLINIEAIIGGKTSGTFNPKQLKSKDVGWASLSDGSKGCAVAMKDFWRLLPTAVETDGSGNLRAVLFSERAAKPINIHSGESRTVTTRYVFFNDDAAAEQRALCVGADNPLFPVASPAWYCRYTHAFGRVAEKSASIYSPANWNTITTLDGKLNTCWTTVFNLIESRFGTDAYGFLEWGDGLHYTWGVITDVWNLSWDGNYYDLAHMGFHHFARTGDLRYLDFGIAHANHIEDIHQCHYDPGERNINGGCRYCPATNHVAWDQETEAHVENHPSHHKTQSMFENYWMTGDPRALDVALEGCDWLYGFSYTLTVGDNIATYTRRVSHLIHSLCYGYYQSKKPQYLNQLLLNWNSLKNTIKTNAPMGQDWMNGFLMEGLADLYYLASDVYTDTSSTFYTLKDSILIYLRVYADRKFGSSNSNSAVGYAFLSYVLNPSYLSQATSKLNSFNTSFSNKFKDFAETGRSLEKAAYYLALRDSLEDLVAVEDPPAGWAGGETGLTVYPNPFNDRVKIAGSGERLADGFAKIVIYDAKGRIVHTLSATGYQLSAGIAWDTSGLPPGVYMVRARVDGKTYTRPVTLVK